MMPIYLTPEGVRSLEYELIPAAAKVKLTRLLSIKLQMLLEEDSENHLKIRFLNRIVNRANSLNERKIYVLKSDSLDFYQASEFAWHESEFQVAIRRLNPAQFIEFLAETVAYGDIELTDANDLLEEAESSVRLEREGNQILVSIAPLEGAVELDRQANPNLRDLVGSMDKNLDEGNYPAALSASAMAIEVISKERLGTTSVAKQTFGSYVEGYKKHSLIPDSVIDWMLDIYKRRNREPLAAHGQIEAPQITGEEAAIIVEMTKAFVRFERWDQTRNISEGKG